jgi:uncharacterized protein YneF (UPF0154 family)
MFIVYLAIGIIIGFIAGVFVYRNNVNKLEQEITNLKYIIYRDKKGDE